MAKSIDHIGLLNLTPLAQGRDLTWTWAPRVVVDYSCTSPEGRFHPVKDANDLASFSNPANLKHQCPSE